VGCSPRTFAILPAAPNQLPPLTMWLTRTPPGAHTCWEAFCDLGALEGSTPLSKWECANHPAGIACWWGCRGKQELGLVGAGPSSQCQQHWCRPGGCVPGQAKASAPRARLGNWVAPASGEEGTGVLLLGH